jgi:hypothetical protein
MGWKVSPRLSLPAAMELTEKEICPYCGAMRKIETPVCEHCGDRVGLAIKGLKPEEISRDNMFVTKGSMKAYQECKIKFRLSKFSKKTMDVKDKQLYHVAIEHQVIGAVPVKIEGGSEAGLLKPNEEGTVTFKAEKSAMALASSLSSRRKFDSPWIDAPGGGVDDAQLFTRSATSRATITIVIIKMR